MPVRNLRLAVAACAAVLALHALPLSAEPPAGAAAHEPVAGLSPAEQKFVDKLLDALNAKDADAAFAMVSMKDVADRATKDLSAMPQEIEMVHKAILEEKLPQMFSRAYEARDGGKIDVAFSVLRAEKAKGGTRVTLRVRSGLVQYLSLELAPAGPDAAKCVDVQSPYMIGWLSELLHFNFLIAIQAAHHGAIESASVVKLTQGFGTGDYKQVLEDYASLPDPAKNSRWVQRIRVAAATHLESADIIAAAEDAKKLFPDDTDWDQSLVWAYYNEKKWPELLRALDGLDATYKDPQMAEVKAAVCIESGDPAMALALAKETLAKDPKNRKMLDLVLQSSLHAEDWAGVTAALGQIEKATGESMYDDVRKDADYKGYRKSDPGKAWLAEKRKQAGKK